MALAQMDGAFLRHRPTANIWRLAASIVGKGILIYLRFEFSKDFWPPEVAPICRTLQVLNFGGYIEAQRSVRCRENRLAGMAVRGADTARI
jgi:hypothetical protein